MLVAYHSELHQNPGISGYSVILYIAVERDVAPAKVSPKQKMQEKEIDDVRVDNMSPEYDNGTVVTVHRPDG